MFDGVGWAAGEIVVFMLIATSIGLAIGWIIGRWLLQGGAAAEFESQISAERERADLAENAVADGRAELDEVRLQLQAEQSRLAELEDTAHSQRTAIEDLEEKLAEAAAMDVEIKRLAAELDARGGLEAELADTSGALAEGESEIQRLEAGLAEAQSQIAGLEAELAEAAIAAERTAADLAERDAMAAKLAESRARAADADRLEIELASSVVEREDLIVEVGRLRAELTEARSAADEVAALGEIAAATESRVPDHPELSVEEQAAGEQDFVPEVAAEVLTKDEGLARMAEIAARTAGEGPIADDDLKKVHGIGPKLESTLKALGITSFRQIANFQPEDIVAVTSALNAFKGRIERDDWMSSAAQQHVDKYGEPV